MTMRTTRLALIGLVIALAACGEAATTSSTTTTSTIVATTVTSSTTSQTGAPGTSTTGQPTTTSTTLPTSTTTGLPGEPIEFGPAEGDIVAVIGVAHDDVLNLRAAPGASQPILKGIPPLYDSLTALGQTRDLGQAFWIAVDYQGTEGWVNFRYIGYLGATTDETAAVVQNLGETPATETMLELGRIVAESMESEEDPRSEIVLTAAPVVGDLGEVTYDVIGLGDDAVRGLRVHVFGQPEDEAFILKTVEMTTLCGRGVTEDGFCI